MSRCQVQPADYYTAEVWPPPNFCHLAMCHWIISNEASTVTTQEKLNSVELNDSHTQKTA